MAIQDDIPKSRITLKYKTEINGQKEDVKLPFRLAIMGDMSAGTSKDRQAELDEREIRELKNGNELDAMIKDMGINLKLNVENKVNPEIQPNLDVELPITSMRSFSPDEIAKHVPKVRSLLHVRELLKELQASADNTKNFRKLLNDILTNPGAAESVKKELENYATFKLPKAEQKAADDDA